MTTMTYQMTYHVNYEQMLEAKARELRSSCRRTEEIAIERAPDSMDDIVLANERELAVDAINRDALVLQQVSDALRRIRAGTYGVCRECEQPIASKRLAAVPWAALCLTCQEAADQEGGAIFSSAA